MTSDASGGGEGLTPADQTKPNQVLRERSLSDAPVFSARPQNSQNRKKQPEKRGGGGKR